MAVIFERDLQQFSQAEYLKPESTRSYLETWCYVNGDLRLVFLPRSEWLDKVEAGLLIEDDWGVEQVAVPEDLKLWEMLGLVDLLNDLSVSDRDQFQREHQRLREAVLQFRQTALYLKNYVELIDWSDDEMEAKNLAASIAAQFYQFSRSLLKGKPTGASYEKIPKVDFVGENLTAESEVRALEKTKYEIEGRLMGVDFVRKHYDRLEKRLGRPPSIDEVEAKRQSLFKIFFKALSRDYSEQLDFQNLEIPDPERAEQAWREYSVAFLGVPESELSEAEKRAKINLQADFLQTKPWSVGPNLLLQLSTVLGMKSLLALPMVEMEQAIFRRGKKQLLHSLRAPQPETEIVSGEDKDQAVTRLLDEEFGLNVDRDRQLLAKKLEIERLGTELAELKNKGVPESKIAAKELEIVDLIQAEISQYQYATGLSMPNEVVQIEQVNCVGAVLVSGMLLEAVGIRYLVGGVNNHAVNIILTSDGELHFRDMRITEHNCVLSAEQFGENQLAKIKLFAETGAPAVLRTNAEPNWYRQVSLSQDSYPEPHVEFFQPNEGVYAMIIDNFTLAQPEFLVGSRLDEKSSAAAIENYLNFMPDDSRMIDALIERYLDLNLIEGAILYLHRLEQLTPGRSRNFGRWASLFIKIERPDLAIEACRQGLVINPLRLDFWEVMAEIHQERGEVENQLATYFQARFHLDFAGFTKKAIDLLVGEGRVEEALTQYELLLNEFPDDQSLWQEYRQLRVDFDIQGKS